MTRTPGTRTSRITQTSATGLGPIGFDYGTQSDIDGSNFEDPKDISDIAGIETDIGGSQGTPPRRPPMGGIDLGKGLDLEKPRPPRLGIGIEIGKSPSGNLGIGVEVPIGLSPFGARGGVSIDPATGEIRGGYGGLGVGKGPISASVDVGVDAGGCYQYVTVSAGPFSHTYGRNVCESKGKNENGDNTNNNQGGSWEPWEDKGGGMETTNLTPERPPANDQPWEPPPYNPPTNICRYIKMASFFLIAREGSGLSTFAGTPRVHAFTNSIEVEYVFSQASTNYKTRGYLAGRIVYEEMPYPISGWPQGGVRIKIEKIPLGDYNVGSYPYTTIASDIRKDIFLKTFLAYNKIIYPKYETRICPTNIIREFTPQSPPSPSYSPPIPNPPPKKMNDDCCKVLIALQLETLRMLGRQVGPEGLMPVSRSKGFLGEEIERTATPIDPQNPDKKIKISFSTFYELASYLLQQQISLDTAFDPLSFKRPQDGSKLQNPKYSRDSEESLTTNVQPKRDKLGNERELEIGKDVFILSALDQQKYIFESLKRLEYLFPFGELSDAQIDKELLIPRKKGDQSPKQNIKIHNMIHAYEIQMQYLNAILGNPREAIFLKDVDPSKEGDQEFSFNAMSLSHLVRELFKFQLDTSGDVDMTRESAIRSLRTNLANRIQIVQIAEMVQALFEDSGMLEDQDWIEIPLEGDPYAGHWKQGQGFQPSAKLDSHKEEDIEELGRATNKNFVAKVKVSRRDKREKTDMRDLIRGLADFMQRLASNPAADLDKMFENAKFKVKTEMALIRANVAKAATVARNRTRKKKK